MASPVDPLGGGDAGDETNPKHEPPVRSAAPTAPLRRLLPLSELRRRGRDTSLTRRLARRRVATCARLDQARLQLAHEVRVVCEGLRELPLDAALAGRAVGKRLELVREAFHFL